MRRWVDFFAGLTPEALDGLDALTVAQVRFRDPFNDVTGRPALKAVFRHMFDVTDDPCFTVTHAALDGRVALLRWTFRFRRKGRRGDWTFQGMSEVHFDADGLVLVHIDHWDSAGQFYARLPVLGWVMARIGRRLSAPPVAGRRADG